ncbi:Arylsulfatase J [Oopsacas minuta]|uniref:Arylsulfatase J n=1 Tax=Oopsacas minuta TaxID=111878 RepID=A0AAV7JUD8_9METZ|nr:Arylsulfatase J [Oopsacas minuta]
MAARCDTTNESIPNVDIENGTCETEAELESLKEFEDVFFKIIDESKVDTQTFTSISIEECGKIIEDEKVILTTIYERVKYPSDDDRIFEVGICFGDSKIKKEDEISITFQLPPDYPNSIPIFQVNNSESYILSFSETDQLYDELLQSAFDQRGSPMLYNLIQQVHDSCEKTILYKKEKLLDSSLHRQIDKEYTTYKTSITTTADCSIMEHTDSTSYDQTNEPVIHPSSFISLRDIIDNCKTAGYRVNGVENVLRPGLAKRFIATQDRINLMEKQYKRAKNFSCKVEIVYHGTAERNLPSIVSKGLLLPGTEKVRILNGSAYGVGIYVGTSPAVSMGYTRSSKLLVCALIPGLKLPLQSGPVANFRIIDGGTFYVITNPSQLVPCWVVSLSPEIQQGTDLGVLAASTKSATNSEAISDKEKQELLEARMRKFLPFGFGPGDRTVILDAGDWDDEDDAILEGRNADDNIIIDYGIVREEKSELQDFRYMHEADLGTAETSYMAILSVAILILLYGVSFVSSRQPNIVFILPDDLGFYDVGYHGASVFTPTITNLTAEGVQLEQYYVQPECTPTRASLMTGRYPIHLGFQNIGSIKPAQSFGLSLNFTLLPQKLRELGYTTHGIGKWHLGYYNPKYLPTNRGFDTYFGYYGSEIHYFTHTSYDVTPQPPPDWCLDLHNNTKCVERNGTYTVDMYTDEAIRIVEKHDADTPMFMYYAMQNVHTPLEVPAEYEHLYYEVRSIDRRKTLGILTAMDYSIARIVASLKKKGDEFWENTVIIFASDNGGWPIPDGHGSNYPLRGAKFTYFEGGIRVPAFVHSPLIKNPRRIERSLFHVSDWYPTLLSLAGGTSDKEEIDGYDQWKVISEGASETVYTRYELLHNLQAYDGRYTNSAIRLGKWKLITGVWANCTIESYPFYCFWTPPPEFNTGLLLHTSDTLHTSAHPFPEQTNKAHISKSESSYKETLYDPVMLFDIEQDPYERHDLKDLYPNIVDILIGRLDRYKVSMLSSVDEPWEEANWEKAAKEAGCFVPWNFEDE